MATIKLDVVTPERVVYSDDVDMVIARSLDGDLGILANHAPLIAALKMSILRIKKDNKITHLAVSGGGFMEVNPQKITVLADAAERPVDIDVERARAAKERAEKRIASPREDVDMTRAEAALRRAMTRLEAVEKEKGN